jgi:predicted RNase H-like nuclease (RuvC/YqgF family)
MQAAEDADDDTTSVGEPDESRGHDETASIRRRSRHERDCLAACGNGLQRLVDTHPSA